MPGLPDAIKQPNNVVGTLKPAVRATPSVSNVQSPASAPPLPAPPVSAQVVWPALLYKTPDSKVAESNVLFAAEKGSCNLIHQHLYFFVQYS